MLSLNVKWKLNKPKNQFIMDTPGRTAHYHDVREPSIKRVSWSALFAGTIVMLVALMLLSLLGLGIGLTSYNPLEEARPMQGIGTGALIWWVISNLIAIFTGAYVAANLTTLTYKASGVYHGILTWCLYTLISAFLMTTAVGSIISGVGNMVSGGVSAFGQGISQLAGVDVGQMDTERINVMIQDALERDQRRAGETQREFDIDVMAVIQDVFFVDGQIQTDVDRQQLEQSIARNSTLEQQDVSRAADVIMEQYQRVEQRLQRLEQDAERIAQETSDGAGKAAIWGFVALLLGAAAAALGGHVGKPDVGNTQTRPRVV